MGDDVAAILLTLAAENAELSEQLAVAQDMLIETAVDAGQLHAHAVALAAERDTWRVEAERLGAWPRMHLGLQLPGSRGAPGLRILCDDLGEDARPGGRGSVAKVRRGPRSTSSQRSWLGS